MARVLPPNGASPCARSVSSAPFSLGFFCLRPRSPRGGAEAALTAPGARPSPGARLFLPAAAASPANPQTVGQGQGLEEGPKPWLVKPQPERHKQHGRSLKVLRAKLQEGAESRLAAAKVHLSTSGPSAWPPASFWRFLLSFFSFLRPSVLGQSFMAIDCRGSTGKESLGTRLSLLGTSFPSPTLDKASASTLRVLR